MVRAPKTTVKLCYRNEIGRNPLISKRYRKRALYLKLVVFRGLV
jgi:hypothetical protein